MRLRPAALLAIVLAAAACGQASSPQPQQSAAVTALSAPLCGVGVTAPGRVDHVVWIIMENHPYPDIIGNSTEAPYINGTMVRGCGLATDYHNASHPSVPNYLALSAGTASGDGRNSDCAPSDCPQSAPSIYASIEAASLQWRVYEQSMPSNCVRQGAGEYTVHHNPALYYSGIRCQHWDVPMGSTSSGALASDLAADRLPALSLLVPDKANDMHDGPISAGDAWLATWMPLITRTPNYRAGRTVVFVVWDEGEGGAKSYGQDCATQPTSEPSCWVPLIVMSASTPAGARLATASNHYSLLRTTEELLGLTPLLGRAVGAVSLRGAFDL